MLNWNSTIPSLLRHQESIWRWSGLLIVSFFLAKTVASILGVWLLPIQLDPLQMNFSRSGFGFESRVDIARITQRNLFDSEASSGRGARPSTAGMDLSNARPSSLSAELLATVVFRNHDFSVGLVKDRSNNSTTYFRAGDRLIDSTVVKVDRFKLYVERNGRYEYLEMQASKINLGRGISISPGSGAGGQTGNQRLEEIKKVDDNRFEITQGSLDAFLSDPSFLQDARAVPNLDANGRIDGFKVVDVKQGSVFEKLGIQRGDVIKKVNNDELNSPEKALTLYTALRNQKRITIDIERNGTILNYSYDIR